MIARQSTDRQVGCQYFELWPEESDAQKIYFCAPKINHFQVFRPPDSNTVC